MASFRHTNTLESVLETAGYPPEHAVTWAEILIRQAGASPVDSALIGFLVRSASPESVRKALAEMPPHVLSLCYARMVAFGMTENEITRLMPEGNAHAVS